MVTIAILLVTPLVIYLLALKLRAPRTRCRFCNEQILEDAMLCKHCGQDQL